MGMVSGIKGQGEIEEVRPSPCPNDEIASSEE
jgi:hypothetical protein